MREVSDVQTPILRFLKEQKDSGVALIYERRQANGWSYHKGKPDLWFVLKGLHVEIETKVKSGKRDTMQILQGNDLQKSCIYAVIRSLEEFKTLFKEIQDGQPITANRE